jgi:ribosomal protein S18 acetylase RimI-like enzyme
VGAREPLRILPQTGVDWILSSSQRSDVGAIGGDPGHDLGTFGHGAVAGDHHIGVAGGLSQPVECRLVGAHLIGAASVEQRDQDIGEHVAGEQDATVRQEDRGVADGVRLMLDDLTRHRSAVRGERGDEADQLERDARRALRRHRLRALSGFTGSAGAASGGVARHVAEPSMPEKVVPVGMGGEPGEDRNVEPVEVIRELVELGTVDAGIDQDQPILPEHHDGIRPDPRTLPDPDTVGDLSQHRLTVSGISPGRAADGSCSCRAIVRRRAFLRSWRGDLVLSPGWSGRLLSGSHGAWSRSGERSTGPTHGRSGLLRYVLELAAGLTSRDLEAVAELERRVLDTDGGRLKLEWGTLRARSGDRVEDLMWWEGNRLLGFLGIYGFASLPELAGMVAPDARRRGIGAALLDAALPLCRERSDRQPLLIVPRPSLAGRRLALRHGGVLEHSEHALVLSGEPTTGSRELPVSLRPATAADGALISRLLELGFGGPAPDDPAARLDSPHEWTEIVELSGSPVGTLRLTRDGNDASIYGFVIDPAWQGRGIGRAALRTACEELRVEGAHRIGLEVDVENDRALTLYTSVGFTPIITEDYFALPLS